MSVMSQQWMDRDEVFYFFFLQEEDGIRDSSVTGVQTCALPISVDRGERRDRIVHRDPPPAQGAPGRGGHGGRHAQIGRASCRGRVEISGGAGSLKKKKRERGERMKREKNDESGVEEDE